MVLKVRGSARLEQKRSIEPAHGLPETPHVAAPARSVSHNSMSNHSWTGTADRSLEHLGDRRLADERVQIDALQRVHDDFPRLEQPMHPHVRIDEDQEAVHSGGCGALVLDANFDGVCGHALLVHACNHVWVRCPNPHWLWRVRAPNGARSGGEGKRRGGMAVGAGCGERVHQQAGGVPAHALQPHGGLQKLQPKREDT